MMSTKWTDANGTERVVRITLGVAEQLRDLCEIDVPGCLTDNADRKFAEITGKLSDTETLFAALVCVHNIPEQEIGQFKDSLDGESLTQAAAALLYGIIGFFPAGRRTAFRNLLTAVETSTKRMTEQALTALNEAMDRTDFDSVVAQSVIPGSGSNFTSELLEPTAGI